MEHPDALVNGAVKDEVAELSRVCSVGVRTKEPQRRDGRREKSEGVGAQPNHVSVTEHRGAEQGCPVNPFPAAEAFDAAEQGLFQFCQRSRHRRQPLLIFFGAAQVLFSPEYALAATMGSFPEL